MLGSGHRCLSVGGPEARRTERLAPGANGSGLECSVDGGLRFPVPSVGSAHQSARPVSPAQRASQSAQPPQSAQRPSRLGPSVRSATQSARRPSPLSTPVDSALTRLSPHSTQPSLDSALGPLGAPVGSAPQSDLASSPLDPSPLEAPGLELGGSRCSEAPVLGPGLFGWSQAVVSRETAPTCRPPIAAASWSVWVSRRDESML